jgi:hypothetical protein
MGDKSALIALFLKTLVNYPELISANCFDRINITREKGTERCVAMQARSHIVIGVDERRELMYLFSSNFTDYQVRT